ncbi:3-oxoacyl-[acyl-carrier protein] reductase [Chryseobacterium ginsenosidimutans]|uniref:SDR family NAD(P)-dependent oxidoreductase n=1 Tax=Chryseobacterium ginsenosidimutans TaxID=687846 RepID=UPI00277F44E2|nr:glucose 1-dehydrogenase [Chryseobacterium ginsenosidimutans]MDQ0595252.1 3-oxoacyl-[acyl-carrier protein] reductase [Chryseobacterium ginsenosidimutans]
MSTLENKVTIVTGSSQGIGASIAKHFAAAGAKVVVNYASSKEAAEKVVKEIIDNGGTAIAVQADVSKEADVTRLFEEAKNTFGTLDILVNNAVAQGYAPIEQISVEAFHQSFNVNVLGPILAIQAALKLFGDKGGNIINISSGASKYPLPSASLYSATKAALDAFTIALSKELGVKNVRINSILPGATETEGATSAGVTKGSDYEKMFVEKTPLGRRGQPDDIAKAAVFLASDDAAWITGEQISVSGGMYGF